MSTRHEAQIVIMPSCRKNNVKFKTEFTTKHPSNFTKKVQRISLASDALIKFQANEAVSKP